jgi:two-component system, chemotaxis family, protein-glutamate methylesterase/glutaminase
MPLLKVLIVDDSALFRTLLSNILRGIPNCEVIGTASSGQTALQKIIELEPDLVTLDMEMPEMDGMEVLQELKRRRIRSKVILVSRFTSAGAQITTDALLQGAFDFVLKPSSKDPAANRSELGQALSDKIAAIRENTGNDAGSPPPSSNQVTTERKHRRTTKCEAMIIGCSTGGPDALGQIMPYLVPDFPVPIVIVQHMPEGFTGSLAKRLDEASEIRVVEASEGLALKKGTAVIARGGRHLKLERRSINNVIVHLTEDSHEHNCRPAVDYTLRSAVEAFDGQLLTVILTGMGKDGTEGCRLVREHGGEVIVQDAEGCVVFGMPKAVINAGQADSIVPLPQMAATINSIVGKAKR